MLHLLMECTRRRLRRTLRSAAAARRQSLPVEALQIRDTHVTPKSKGLAAQSRVKVKNGDKA